MRPAAILIATLACSLLVAGCDSDSPTAPLLPDGPVEPVELYAAQSSGIDESRRQVVRQQSELQTVWDEIFAGDPEPEPLPVVDFELFMVLVVAAGEQPNGCHDIEVTSAFADGTDLTVRITETVDSEAGCGCTQAVVQPVVVVRVPRADEVFFQTTTEPAC